MALVTEDGSGLSTAESYSSLAEVLTYITAFKSAANLAVWTGLTTAQQETSARVATQYIDASNRGQWKGYRANETQALGWPRSAVYDVDGYLVASTSLPTTLKSATSEAAFRHANGDTLIADIAAGDNLISESVSVGSISSSATFDGVKTASKGYPIIDRLLSDLTEGPPSGFGARMLERS